MVELKCLYCVIQALKPKGETFSARKGNAEPKCDLRGWLPERQALEALKCSELVMRGFSLCKTYYVSSMISKQSVTSNANHELQSVQAMLDTISCQTRIIHLGPALVERYGCNAPVTKPVQEHEAQGLNIQCYGSVRD
jgi:hypothetical protein